MSMINNYNPLAGYMAADQDDAGDPKYYGFVDASGKWYILAVAAAGTFKYYRGASAYSTGWTNRASFTYNYFHEAF